MRPIWPQLLILNLARDLRSPARRRGVQCEWTRRRGGGAGGGGGGGGGKGVVEKCVLEEPPLGAVCANDRKKLVKDGRR